MPFREATRAGIHTLIGIYGGSNSGKTLSALMIARGMVGPDGDIYMIDTESRRGEAYVGHPSVGKYMVSPMDAPYSSERYTAMILEAVEAVRQTGRESALVIDSMSHEWEAIGGVMDKAGKIAEARAEKYRRAWDGTIQFGDWKQPKIDHRHMVLEMLGAPLHIIVCLRAKYASRQIERKDYEAHGIDPNSTRANSMVIRDDAQTPIQDAGFIYEMLIQIEVDRANPGVPVGGKLDLVPGAFEKGRIVTPECGARVMAWLNTDAAHDATEKAKQDPANAWQGQPEAEALIVAAKSTARGGMEEYRAWFTGLADDSKRILTQTTEPDDGDFRQVKSVHDICKRIAGEADG